MSSDTNDAPEGASEASKTTSSTEQTAPAADATPGVDAATHAAVVAERDRYKDALLRSMADLDNVRKRTRRDVDDARSKSRGDVLLELLPVFDNLERAMQYTTTAKDVAAIAKGIDMVLRLFDDTLGRLGGKRLRTVGQPFDPSQHEAIQQIESAEHPSGTVAREEVPGYVLDGRLLRPAMVVVSKGPGAEAPKADKAEGEKAPDGDKPAGEGSGGAS